MRVIAVTNNPARLSFLVALLADAGVPSIVFDPYTSALEGNIGAIPRRLMVATRQEAQAYRLLCEAGENDPSG